MAKKWNKALAFALALCMCAGSMNVTAWATTTTETVDVPAKPGGEEIKVDIAIEKEGDSLKVEGEAKKDGIEVEVNGNFETATNEQGETKLVNGSATYEAESTDGTYEAEGGYEIKTEEKAPNVKVDVSLEAGGSDSKSSESSSEDLEIPDVAEYDETATSVTGGKVTVKTDAIEMENTIPKDANGNPIADNMDYYENKVEADKGKDLGIDVHSTMNENKSSNTSDTDGFIFDVAKGYEFVYVGTDNTSYYFPAIVFDRPLTEKEKEEIYYNKAQERRLLGYTEEEVAAYMDTYKQYSELTVVGPDEKTYYLHRFDAIGNPNKDGRGTEGWYQDGEWLTKQGEGSYKAVYSTIHQFTMVDEKGNKVTTYCADQNTTAELGHSYNVENLEDATYYSEAEAAMIRTIAENGYWGQIDDPETEKVESGSLEAMKAMMAAAKGKDGKAIFSQNEIDQLTDGMAMTATQCAIWSCSNKMSGVEFINMQYASGLGTSANYPNMFDLTLGEEQLKETDLILKLYNHLINMEPTPEPENPSTANTVITKKNFLKDISLSVLEKAEGHVNNQDDNKDNDAYVTELTFSLVVEPSTANGDDMIVTILAGGQEYKCRLAGDDSKDGDDFVPLAYNSETKNYILSGITLTEGDINFNITLEGIQNLQEGVYLYTSEVKDVGVENVNGDIVTYKDVSSQTFVGRGSGQRAVGVSMNLSFDLDVQDEIVVTERQWRSEETHEIPPYDPPYDPEEYDDDKDIPEDPVPLSDLVDIFDEEIPLANVPQTGANNTSWSALAAVAGLMMAVVALGKKNK